MKIFSKKAYKKPKDNGLNLCSQLPSVRNIRGIRLEWLLNSIFVVEIEDVVFVAVDDFALTVELID